MQHPASETSPETHCLAAAQFRPTHWSIVLSAADQWNPSNAVQALEQMCRPYWRPLYAYMRRQGKSPHDDQDLKKGVFAWTLKKSFHQGGDQGKGRFRSFLLAAPKHFLSNERDHVRAQKRGGPSPLPLDFAGEIEDELRHVMSVFAR